ncbi:hypothetical protein [Spongiactinospora sp. 9N601]|uniref:hypothetical protein n=1 Tax=Spongiactinospora sp. 9N601 TaxID=3375149 RepID=UPI0037B1C753
MFGGDDLGVRPEPQQVADRLTFAAHCAGAVTIDRILIDGQAVLDDLRFALHLSVHNGLITRHHMYEDSLAVAEAFC